MRIERLNVAHVKFLAHHCRKLLEVHAWLGLIAVAISPAVDECAKWIGSNRQARTRLGGKFDGGLSSKKRAAQRRGHSRLQKRTSVHSSRVGQAFLPVHYFLLKQN